MICSTSPASGVCARATSARPSAGTARAASRSSGWLRATAAARRAGTAARCRPAWSSGFACGVGGSSVLGCVVWPGGRIATTFWMPEMYLNVYSASSSASRLSSSSRRRRLADPDRAVAGADPAQVVGDRVAAQQRQTALELGSVRTATCSPRRCAPVRRVDAGSVAEVDDRHDGELVDAARSGRAARGGRRSPRALACRCRAATTTTTAGVGPPPLPFASDRDRDRDRADREPREQRRRGAELVRVGERLAARASRRRPSADSCGQRPVGGVLLGRRDDRWSASLIPSATCCRPSGRSRGAGGRRC